MAVSIWHPSKEPVEAGAAPTPRVLRPIERKLAFVLERAWPARRTEIARLVAKLRGRSGEPAKAVTEASIGVPSISLPRGVLGTRADFELRSCKAFGRGVVPIVTIDGIRISAELGGARVAPAPRREAASTGAPTLPPRSSCKPARVRWTKPLSRREDEWRGRVAFGDRSIDVLSSEKREPREEVVALALGLHDAVLTAAAPALARIYAEGGWGRSPLTPERIANKLRLRTISVRGSTWVLSFADGGLFRGHRVELWPEGRKLGVDLVG